MGRKTGILAILGGLIVASGALAKASERLEPVSGQDQEVVQLAPQPSVELPPDLARVLRDYERHWSAGEAEALASLFVESGLIVRRGTWIRGRAAIEEAYRHASGALRLRAIEFDAGDRLGYIIGAYGYGESLPVDDSGMFVLTLRRDPDGRWLIVSDLDRSAS